MTSNIQNMNALSITAMIGSIFFASSAHAQGMNNDAWSPSPANRASIAALIRQVENDDSSSASSVLGYGGNVTQLICGANSGEGNSTSANAQANSSCIILNNSDGTLNIDQISDGDQTADADNTSTTTVDETINNAGGADEILDILANN